MRVRFISIILLFGVFLGVMGCKEEPERSCKIVVSLPQEVQQRVNGDGLTATKLHCYVYLNGTCKETKEATFASNSLTTTLDLDLPKGITFELILYAQSTNGNYTYNTSNYTLTRQTIPNSAERGAEQDDMFYATKEITPTGNGTVNITLTRGVAQLNVCLDNDDWTACTKYYTPKIKTTITNVYTTLNLKTGAVGGATSQMFYNNVSETSSQTSPVSGAKWVASNYFFTNGGNVTVNIKALDGATEMVAADLSNVPVQMNYRTNIHGSFLTTEANITATQSTDWGGNNNKVQDGGINKTPTTATVPYNTGFDSSDDNDDWRFYPSNGNVNRFIIGPSVYYSEGNSLYITNNGSSHMYSTSPTQGAMAYRKIHLNAGTTYDISFKYLSNGEENYDYGSFLIINNADLNYLKTASDNGYDIYSTYDSFNPDRIDQKALYLTNKLHNQAGFYASNGQFYCTTTGDYYIVIYWRNDYSGGNPDWPLCVDDLSITVHSGGGGGSLNYTTSFENSSDLDGWSYYSNMCCYNYFLSVTGTGTSYGSKAMAIVNDIGHYGYCYSGIDPTRTVSFAYHAFTLEGGASYHLSFVWKCYGEYSYNTDYDYGVVFVTDESEATIKSVADETSLLRNNHIYTNAVSGSNKILNQEDSWVTEHIYFTAPYSGSYYLVFGFGTDSSGSDTNGATPLAIDNVTLKAE